MKIVHIEDAFHPDAGYQVNILCKYLKKFGHEQVIIAAPIEKTPDAFTSFFGKDNITEKDYIYQESGAKVIRLPVWGFLSGRAVFTRKLYKTIKKEKPDVLYLHGNDTLSAIMMLTKLRKLNCAVVSDSHMLEMASKNRFNLYFRKFYKRFITPIIIKNNITVIRTQDDLYVEKHLGIPISQAPWISYGTDTLIFNKNQEVKLQFRKENGIGEDDFVFVYTGKLDEFKGGLLLAKAFKKRFDGQKNVVLVVVGKTADDEYGREVEQIFSESENKILRFPTQKYTDLPKFYQSADVSVFARQCSLSFYDASGCGLPVLSEDNNINIDRNSHNNGLCFRSGDVDDFRAKIQAFLDMSGEEYREMSDNAYKFIEQNYDYEDKAREYERVLLEAVEKFEGR